MDAVIKSSECVALLRLADRLARLVGSQNVLMNEEDRSFYSMDMFSEGTLVDLVVVPSERAQVGEAVRLCTGAGYAVIPRGGGMSYTSGYLSDTARAAVFDLSRLTGVIEINAEDMYVTVECGCTWKALNEALAPKGLRTPYFGPISGGASTIGGALSQNSIYWGSATYGTAADSVLCLEAVLADGTTIITGSAADRFNPSPFYRPYGPDLTGLFLADTGALGLKLSATLRLINLPKINKFASFAYDTHQELIGAISEISRAGIASECFGTDAFAGSARMQRETLSQDLAYLWGIIKTGNSWIGGLWGATRLAIAGRRAFEDVRFAMHVTISADNAAIADQHMKMARRIGSARGKDIEPSFPRAARGTPFSTGNGVISADGRRYIPTHGISPHSRAKATIAAIYEFFASHAAEMKAQGVDWGCITGAIGRSAVVIEPLIYWGDESRLYDQRMVDDERRNRLKQHTRSEGRMALVTQLRTGLKEIYREYGCVHLQIGRSYPYRDTRLPETFAMLEQIKRVVDPHGLMNPGSLGL